MNTIFDILFNDLGYNNFRNSIFQEFHSKLDAFKNSINNQTPTTISNLYVDYYIKKNENIIINDFIFKTFNSGILFHHIKRPEIRFIFRHLKEVEIY